MSHTPKSASSGFVVSASGLTVNVDAGYLRQLDDSAWSFPPTSITLPTNGTWLIVIDIQTKALHAWTRSIHTGCIPVATVVAAGGVVTSISAPPITGFPPTKIPEFKAKVKRNNQQLHVVVIGDSLVEGYTATATDWVALLFDQAQSAAGYNFKRPDGTPCLGQMTVENYGMGGTTAYYGAALFSERIRTAFADSAGALDCAIKFKSFFAAKYLGASGLQRSPLLTRNPDLAIINWGINGGPAWLAVFEQLVRMLRLNGTEVVILTGDKRSDGSNNFPETDFFDRLKQVYGCELVDTREYVAESVAFGGSPYRDTVHMNQTGYNLYATAVRSVLSDIAQYPDDDALPSIQSFLAEDNFRASAFPKAFEIDFDPWAKTGGPVQAAPSGLDTTKLNPTLLFAARIAAQTSYALAGGTDSAVFAHPHAIGFSLLLDTSTTCTVGLTVGGITLPTISVPGAAVKYGTLEGGFFLGANWLANQGTVGQNAWFVSHATVSAGAVTAPDGIASAANSIVEDSTASTTHFAQQNLVAAQLAKSTQYCFSVYAKAGSRTRIGVAFNNLDSATFPTTIFDLANGTVAVNGSGLVSKIEPASYTYPNAPAGWYRCSVNRDSGTAANIPSVTCYLDSGSGNAAASIVYSGNGSGNAYMWGGKFELGSAANPSSVPSALHPNTWLNSSALALIDLSHLLGKYRGAKIPWSNLAVKIAPSAGTCRILGVVWHTYPNDQLVHTLITGSLETRDGFAYAGTWLSENWAANCPSVYTDTDLDTVVIPFVGTGIQVLLGAGTAGGKVDAWLDGVQVETLLDLYISSGSKVYSVDAFANQANGLFDRGYGKHVLVLKRNGANASSGASGAGNRKLSVLAAYQFDTR